MTPFPITEIELRILKICKQPLLKPDIVRKFKFKERKAVDSMIGRLVCYGVIKQIRHTFRYSPKQSYSKTLYQFDGREVVVKDDETVKQERTWMITRDNLYTQFGVSLPRNEQDQIIELAAKDMPRSIIAKQLKIPKLLVIQTLIANETEVNERRKHASKSKAN